MLVNRVKVFFLALGDVLALYASLLAMLVLRYEGDFYLQLVNNHFWPFTFVFAIWMVVFYIAGLYELRRLRNNIEFLKVLALAIAVNAFIAILAFYLVASFGITPKTNLFIVIGIFAVLEVFWRRRFNAATAGGEAPNKILLLGNTDTVREIENVLCENPQLGYAVKSRIAEDPTDLSRETLLSLVKNHGINLVVIPAHLKKSGRLADMLYTLLTSGIEVHDATNFYESIVRKVPLRDLDEAWFFEHLAAREKFYDPLKRAWEFIVAIVLGIALLPLELVIALIVKLASPGPVIYKQVRVGRHGREFTLYKFRTMPVDSEKNGAQWATKDDRRAGAFGKILRNTHLDELPQLLNIVKGELSFVGPRPERPEFVKILKEQVPYYETRLLVKPGVTGWAQIHYRKDETAEDVAQKLEYDIYYLKNRSPILDTAIVLKTVKSFFTNPK